MPSAYGAAAAAALTVIGTVASEIAASGDEAEYERFMKEAASAYGNISVPELQALIAQEAGQSAHVGAPNDFGNRGARDAAIQALVNEGLAGGNSLDAKLSQAQAQRAAGQATRQATQGALSSAASRGVGGAASVLQAQLLGASQGADRAAQVGLQGAANARQTALQALQQGGGMAGQAEAQDSSRDLARRQAMDAMAQFNASQRQRTNEFNSGLIQQGFQNRLQVSDRRSASARMRADLEKAQAEALKKKIGGTADSLAQLAANF